MFELTGLEIRKRFNCGPGKLTLQCHKLCFGSESEQENGMAMYERDGWEIIQAGLSKAGGYYFKAVQKWQNS